jgi:hypothetical protein
MSIKYKNSYRQHRVSTIYNNKYDKNEFRGKYIYINLYKYYMYAYVGIN